LINKAFLLEKAGDYEETVKILKRILENEPDNPAALNFLAYLYAENDVNLDEALNLVTRALNQDSENPAYLDTKAWILYKKGEFEKAMVLQKKALNQAPEDKELREHMEAILKALEIEKSVDEFIKN
jgi:tetratricopeptide (TPR) repeat protein